MKKFFLALLLLLLNSCGSLISSSITETLFNQTSIATSLIDYGVKKHTGKKLSEHAISKITGKDCEINIENLITFQSFCRDKEVMENNNIMTKNKEVAENNYIITKNKVVPQRQNNKSYLLSIAPKLKNILIEKPSISNQVYSLTLNEVLNKDFNSLGLKKNN
jgi:hypothetical protein